MNVTLLSTSPSEWLDCVLEHFDDFLIDHAACERKASAVATSMICHYPDKKQLVMEMADLALEEMSHYREVLKLIAARDITLTPDTKDPYVNELRNHVQRGRASYFLDRLIIAGIVEARGTERFSMIAQAHTEPAMKTFYQRLTESEARHQQMFIDLACHYIDTETVHKRLSELQVIEADIVDSLPIRAALH